LLEALKMNFNYPLVSGSTIFDDPNLISGFFLFLLALLELVVEPVALLTPPF
jgi:hypothetical protein